MSAFKMRGVIPPMIVPFKENGEVDYGSLKQLTAFLKDRVDGLFVTGSYGSGAMLTMEERMRILECVLKEVGGKIPVISHVGTADSISAAKLARNASSAGAAAVSAVGPFYYKHNADGVCAFYEAIREASEVPVYIYNNPQFQGYPMDLALLRRLKNAGMNGIKDATFDIMLHANYMRLLKDDQFDVALGTEAMWLSACVLGCQAFIPGIGNVFPEICRKMFEEGMRKDYDQCRETQFQVNELRDIMYLARSTQLAVYTMLELRGIIRAYPRSPFIPATEEEKEAIRKRLVALQML